MPTFLSFNDLVLSYLQYLRLVQPNLDTKPGTVARDLVVDVNSQQLANLYTQLNNVYGLQSLFSASGTDLNNLASNFNVTRSQGTNATGTAVFTTNSLTSDIAIPQGTVVTAQNGITFATTTSATMAASSINVYVATATNLSTQLALASITDKYAIEIPVEAQIPGSNGNIGQFSLTAQNIAGISNVTNVSSFSGGTDQESDTTFRNRILSIFAGSNTGTALGYTNTLTAINGITGASVVGPGNPLMTRDGTVVTTNSNGQLIIQTAGSGGKVDLYILGNNQTPQIDTFIYTDNSGKNDPTNALNNWVLGQNGQSTTTNTSQRRVTLLASGQLPEQPVDNIISVSGSSSGSNFVAQYIATDGTIKGNYVLQKDTGAYAGSPFGFDQLHWISNQINLSGENDTKGVFNGQDPLVFSDVTEITSIDQSVLVTNENSTVSASNRALITLKHTPISTVTSVANLTTGEKYVITNQNPNGASGGLNTSGVIQITGSTLPILTDVLQVNYTWLKPFDPVFDFDNLHDINTLRTVQDSVDWSFGNLVQKEPSTVAVDAYGNKTVIVTDNISKVIYVLTVQTQMSTVSSGSVVVNVSVNNVLSIRRVSDNAELYNTDSFNGTASGNSIILPTDTLGKDGDAVTVYFNWVDNFTVNSVSGSFMNNVITLPITSTLQDGYSVLVDYVANVSTLLSNTNLASLPAVQLENTLTINGLSAGVQPTSNIYNTNGITFKQNLRKAGSNIQVDCENIGGNGIISVAGTTFNKVDSVFVTVLPGDGLTIDLTEAIQTALGTTNIPSTVQVAKLYSVKQVILNSTDQISSIVATYDVVNYQIANNQYDLSIGLQNTQLNNYSIKLPSTPTNIANELKTGDVVQVTFYYVNTADTETLFYSRNGIQITEKVFSTINKLGIVSGFQTAKNILQGNITATNFNQPASNTNYSSSYNYIAPKQGERITINYNSNSLVDTATFAIENVRPITADVLVKAATAISINITVNIKLLPQYQSSSQTVQQNVVSTITNFLNATSLGTTIAASSVVNQIYSVSGIQEADIINFSTATSGNQLSITAQSNQYLSAGIITVNIIGS